MFMSLGVVGEYAKSLFATSPCTHRFFPRVGRKFCVPQTTLHLPYSPYTLKYFPRILYRRLNTFRVFSVCASRREKYSRSEGARTVQNFGKIEFKGYIWT
jgi:hypothetical protein